MPHNPRNLSTVEQKKLLLDLLSLKSTQVFPLSLAQQRLWFLDQLYPGNPAWNVPFGLRLQGNLDRSALETSVQEMIRRHEILRTTFETDAGHPVQIVAADFGIEIPFLDLADIASSDRPSEAFWVGMQEARVRFNLAAGPLLRLKLIRLSTDEHLLVCVMHHIVCDGWSLEIFVRELAALYEQRSGGRHFLLPDLPIQYGDFAEWQREWMGGGLLADQTRYWKQKLAGAPACLRLPADHVRPPEQTYDGASQAIAVPMELIHDLTVLALTQRATLFMVMLAAFKTLLHSYTGGEDILVGVPVAGRNRVELEGLIGFFVNTLVMRTNLSGDPHFSDLLLQEREVALDAFGHADLPFEKLVEELNPTRTLSYSPVIQVMFSAVRAGKFPRFGDVAASPYPFASHSSLFDLSMNLVEDAEDRSWLRVEYATALFDHGRMAKMLDHYLTLLRAIAAQPELRISELVALLECGGNVTRNLPAPSYRDAYDGAASRRKVGRSHPEGPAEPRDPLEQILVRIWERVLGTSRIRIDDDFFDLGGHSLLAAYLVSEIEKAVGSKFPLSSLFRGPTIQSLAELIRQGTAWSPDPLLIEMCAGSGGFPIFAIAESGVDTLGYGLLARHMGTEQPFYKLQAHAPTCSIVPYSIEEFRTIAREYIGAMRAIQEEGPFFLVGMCNGVHIAEQMVLELEAEGHEVGLLAIIDTFVLQQSEIRWLARFESFRNRRRYFSKMPISLQLSHYSQALKKRLRRVLLHETEPLSPRTKAVWPGKDFHPKQFRAPVLLFKRAKQPYFKVRDPEMGWGTRSLTGVKVCTANIAMHEAMLREPAVEMLAQQLREALHRVGIGDSFDARSGQSRNHH